jgi:hypothetical protein
VLTLRSSKAIKDKAIIVNISISFISASGWLRQNYIDIELCHYCYLVMKDIKVGNSSFRSTGEPDQLNQEGGDSLLQGVTMMLRIQQQLQLVQIRVSYLF